MSCRVGLVGRPRGEPLAAGGAGVGQHGTAQGRGHAGVQGRSNAERLPACGGGVITGAGRRALCERVHVKAEQDVGAGVAGEGAVCVQVRVCV